MEKNNRPSVLRGVNYFKICIDDFDGDISGRLYNIFSPDENKFTSLGEFLRIADYTMDCYGTVQSFTDIRRFKKSDDGRYIKVREASKAETERKYSDEQWDKLQGKTATFCFTVASRQNGSWQGKMINDENDADQSFVCAYQLCDIIISSLTDDGVTQDIPSDTFKYPRDAKFTLCVDDDKNGRLKGKLYEIYDFEPKTFKNFVEFFNIFKNINGEIFSDEREPFKCASITRYVEKEKRMPSAKWDMAGQKATFVIQLKYCQNGSLKGVITHSEKKATQYFRSFSEMLCLIYEVCNG